MINILMFLEKNHLLKEFFMLFKGMIAAIIIFVVYFILISIVFRFAKFDANVTLIVSAYFDFQFSMIIYILLIYVMTRYVLKLINYYT